MVFTIPLFLACLFLYTGVAHGEEPFVDRPLTLSDCVEIALASSPDVVAAQERIEQARAAVGQAQAGFYPRLSLAENFTRTDFAPMVFFNQLAQGELSGDSPSAPPPGFDPFAQFNDPGPLSNWNTQLLLQWPLFQGGKTYYGTRAARASLDAAHTELESVHNDLRFAVTSAYYQILQADTSINIVEESVRQIRKHLEIAQARYETEAALKSDVLRVEVSLAEAEENLAIARHNLERAKSQLNLAMGRPVNTHFALAPAPESPPPDDPLSDTTLQELTQMALEMRPELEAMEKNTLALEHSVEAAKAEYFPHINVFAHYDIDTEDFSDSNDSWTIGVGADISIFDGFLTRSNVERARAELRETEARRERLRLAIEMEVKNAYLAKSEATTRLEVLQQAVAEADETLRIVAERYAEGAALITELLDAQVALTNARLRRLSAKHQYFIASAALERAVGKIEERYDGNGI
ncbi:MAG: TolC family protein [Candidatus Abyssubacteria bacterium]